MQRLLRILQSQIQYKIILPYLVLMVLVMSVGAGIAIYLVASSWQERFNNQLGNVGRNFADSLAQREQANLDFLWQIAFAPPNPAEDTPAVAAAMARRNQEGLERALEPFYRVGALPDNTFNVVLDRLIAFDEQGRSLVHWERPNPENPAERNVYSSTDLSQLELVQKVLRGEANEVGDKYAALITFQGVDDTQAFPDQDAFYLFTVVPVRRDTELVGGLLIASRLEHVLTVLERQSQSEISAIYDTTGIVLGSTVRPNAGLPALDMPEALPQQLVDQLVSAEAYRDCFEAEPRPFQRVWPSDKRACSILDTVSVNDRDFQFLYAPLVIRSAQVGYFSVGLAHDYVTAPWADSRNAVIGVTLLLAVGAMVVGYHVARQITRPLQDLVETAEAVTQGQFERRSVVVEQNEFGTLAQAFNTMIDSLLELSGALKTESERRVAAEGVTDAVYYALRQGLSAERIDDISAYSRPELPRDALHLTAPGLDIVLSSLDILAAAVRAYQEATAPVTRRNILLQANEHLEVVTQQVQNLSEPFGSLMALVIARWRQILTAEGGKLARAELAGPIANPYVAGNPVQGSLFVGREDIMRRLEELWTRQGQVPSVVLYGHRRMGKSSILRNLGERFGAQTVIVDFNMQRVGLVTTTGELLYNLALQLYDQLSPAQQADLGEPDEASFMAQNRYTAFDRFLKRLDAVRGAQRFVVTVDEFELIEELIARGRLEPHLLDFWRGLIQTYPWFVVVFAGLHTLEELRHDYWHPLFGSVTAIPVSFLSPAGARRLITQPSPDFPIDYDQEAIALIIALTNGQPYLVQLIGHALVTRFNRQSFEEGKERARRFTVEDVEAVINAPEFYRDGNAYFNGVWGQAEDSQPDGQTAVLRALGGGDVRVACAGLPLEEIINATGLDRDQVRAALETLQRHDVVALRDDRYVYTVELMRRWVAQRKERC